MPGFFVWGPQLGRPAGGNQLTGIGLSLAEEFDCLFLGVQFSECDGDILFCFARDEETADEMENKYGLHIFIIATDILNRDIGIVMMLPKVLHQGR